MTFEQTVARHTEHAAPCLDDEQVSAAREVGCERQREQLAVVCIDRRAEGIGGGAAQRDPSAALGDHELAIGRESGVDDVEEVLRFERGGELDAVFRREMLAARERVFDGSGRAGDRHAQRRRFRTLDDAVCDREDGDLQDVRAV